MFFPVGLVADDFVDVLIYLVYVNFVLELYCAAMFLYALVMYEALYRGIVYINTQDMSEKGHIVHTQNRRTVQQKYTRSK